MFEQPAYRWADPTWRASAEGWIRQTVEAGGGSVTGPIGNVRFLPWSAVLRAPTGAGDVYFKACGPSQAHEPALAALLFAARPDCSVPILATDLERGWMLMADGGNTLAAAIKTNADEIAHWRRVLALQAVIQRELTPRANELLALGVPDRRPSVLPDLFAAILSRPDHLLVGQSGALTLADLDRLGALVSRLISVCGELAATGPPHTFVHDDFHEDHIFAHQLDGVWHYTFFDYGDACISHPFVQLVSQPRFAANRFGIETDANQKLLREFYLSHWADYASPAGLARALSLALVAGCVIRALTWITACSAHLDTLPDSLRDAYASRVAFWLLQIPARLEALDVA